MRRSAAPATRNNLNNNNNKNNATSLRSQQQQSSRALSNASNPTKSFSISRLSVNNKAQMRTCTETRVPLRSSVQFSSATLHQQRALSYSWKNQNDNHKNNNNQWSNTESKSSQSILSSSSLTQTLFSSSDAKLSMGVGENQQQQVSGGWGSLSLLALLACLSLTPAFAQDDGESKDSKDQAEAKTPPPDDEDPIVKVKYVILGGGPAAFGAILAIRAKDPTGSIVVVTPEEEFPFPSAIVPEMEEEFLRTLVEWGAAQNGELPTVWNIRNDPNLKVLKGITLKENTLDADGKKVSYSDSADGYYALAFDKCLIAGGLNSTNGVKIAGDWQSSNVDQVMFLGNGDDFEAIRADLTQLAVTGIPRSQTLAIVGGGFLGPQLAQALASSNVYKNVNLIFPEQAILDNVLPQYLTDYVTSKLTEAGVNLLPATTVKKMSMARDTDIMNVTLNTKEKTTADHVVLALGSAQVSPWFFLYTGLERDSNNRGIVVNSELQARSDIYVAGELASYYDLILGRRRAEDFDHELHSGFVAGDNMTGNRRPYLHTPFFQAAIGETSFRGVGIVDSSLDTVGVWSKDDGVEGKEYNKGVVYYTNHHNQLVGVLLVNMNHPQKVQDARWLITKQKVYDNPQQFINRIEIGDRDIPNPKDLPTEPSPTAQ